MIKTIITGGIEAPARIPSVIFWNKVLRGEIPEYQWMRDTFKDLNLARTTYKQWLDMSQAVADQDWCYVCDGRTTITDPTYGYIYCICNLISKRTRLASVNIEAQSSWSPAYLSELKIDAGTIRANQALKFAIDNAQKFILEPNKWIMLSGPPGTGKTHIMRAMMTAWQDWFLYIVSTEMISKIKATFGKDSKSLIDAYKYSPGLLIDDFGLQYTTDWAISALDEIIEARARDNVWFDRITVISTNLSYSNFKTSLTRADGNARSASRLLSKNVLWIEMDSQARDHRR